LRNLRFAQIGESLISLVRGLAPLPHGGDGHQCQHAGGSPCGPDRPLMLAVILADQPTKIRDASDRRGELRHGLHELRIAARKTGAQLVPLNDRSKLHPVWFFAEHTREEGRQCVRPTPVEVSGSVIPDDVAARQRDEQGRGSFRS
jgi:hypothetical protein